MPKVFYVITEADVTGREHYVTTKASKSDAEKFIRADYPNARKDSTHSDFDRFYCEDKSGHDFLMFVREKVI